MFQSLLSRAILAGLLLAGLVAAVYIWTRPRPQPDEPGAGTGFRESAAEAGITFRMAFLPAEQGETFKINLYDHGCGVAVGDYDGDGHNDVYFVNQLGPNALYHNNGDGTFTDVTRQAGVGLGDRVCVAATFADTRNNGKPDLFVTSTRGGNVLFRNNGDGTFTDVTRDAGLAVTPTTHSQTAAFFDFDNDGYLDLFVTNTAKWTLKDKDAKSQYFPGPAQFWDLADSPIEHSALYHNNGDGTFTDVTEKSGLKGEGWGGDVAVFDYDEDGRLDLLVTNMFGAIQLYHNDGKGTFSNVTKSVLGRTSFGAIGCKAFDFNNDGKLDLFIAGMHSDMWLASDTDPRLTHDDLKKKYPNVRGPMVFRTSADAEAEQRFVDALTKKSPRDPVGAMVRIHMGDEVMARQVHAAGGYLSQSSLAIHFGLGDRAGIDYAEIFWPGRKTPQRIDRPAINTLHPVRQPSE